MGMIKIKKIYANFYFYDIFLLSALSIFLLFMQLNKWISILILVFDIFLFGVYPTVKFNNKIQLLNNKYRSDKK